MNCCAYSCTQYCLHTQYMLLTHADDLQCLQLHTLVSPHTVYVSNPCWWFAVPTAANNMFFFSQFCFFNWHAPFRPSEPYPLTQHISPVPCPHSPVPTVPSSVAHFAICSYCQRNNSCAVSHNSDVSSPCFLFLASLQRKWSCLVAEPQLDIQHANSNPVYCSVERNVVRCVSVHGCSCT